MEVNIVKEIKNLNTCMIKRMFKEKETINGNHPRPLQVEIISYLSKNQDKTIYQKDLEENLRISKSAISEVLNSMEKNGYIEKINDKEDARKKRVVLTEKTLVEHEKVKSKLKDLNKELISGIDEEELNIFIDVVNKLKNNMRKEKN